MVWRQSGSGLVVEYHYQMEIRTTVNHDGKKEEVMNGIMEKEISQTNWWAVGEEIAMEFCLDDEVDEGGFLDMGYSMESFLADETEDM